jgi:hypothetical protein
VGMCQEDVIRSALLRDPPGVHVDLYAFSAYSYRGLSEPGHSIQQVGH